MKCIILLKVDLGGNSTLVMECDSSFYDIAIKKMKNYASVKLTRRSSSVYLNSMERDF